MCRGLSTFCGILTLQVGVTVLAAVFLTLGAVVLVANMLEGSDDEEGKAAKTSGEEEESSFSYPIMIIMAFAIGLFIIGGLAFFSAYNESRGLAMLALLGLILLTTFWVVLCILSLLSKPETVETICRIPKKLEKELRCPESLWLADLDYRKEGGGGKSKREVNHIFKDLKSNSDFMPHSLSFAGEIQQFLMELRELNLCMKSCCEENWLKNRKEENYSFCNLDIFSRFHNSKRLKKGLIEFNETSNKSSPWADVSNEMQFHFIQKYTMHLLSGFLGTLKTSRFGIITPNVILPLQQNNKGKSTPAPGETKSADKGKDKESKYKSGMPFYAAIGLFIANLIFFLFSAIMLWSWAQELGDECCVVEDYYY